ncbi:MAG: HypC/HybG/HupF family hydrogenase formation chaperone [Caldilineaceae bacterium]
MCLGIPGQVISLESRKDDLPMGRVSFGGIVKEVCLAYVPEVAIGDFVIVHVGFAISRVDEVEAHAVFDFLEQMQELDELSTPGVEPLAAAGG